MMGEQDRTGLRTRFGLGWEIQYKTDMRHTSLLEEGMRTPF